MGLRWPGGRSVGRPGEGQADHGAYRSPSASGFPRIAERFAPFSPTFLPRGVAFGHPSGKKVVGKRYGPQSPSSSRQREAGSRAERHEESPPTCRTGDRAQARGGRPSALEQQRHVVAGPMRCANPERWSRGPRGTPCRDFEAASPSHAPRSQRGPLRVPCHRSEGELTHRGPSRAADASRIRGLRGSVPRLRDGFAVSCPTLTTWATTCPTLPATDRWNGESSPVQGRVDR